MNVIIKQKVFANLSDITLYLLVFPLIFMLIACTINTNKTKPVISVSIIPQKYFVEKIAGDNFDINVLIPPGASPATYDPTPAQIIELTKSKIYFKIGHIEFEKNWLDNISLEYPQLNIIDNSIGIDLLENKYSDHGHHHGFIEPHTWMKPENVKIIANSIYEAILKLDKENETFYTNNFNLFISEIDSLHRMLFLQLQDVQSRSFIIYHPALTYFAEAYNLHQTSIETEGKNPSAFHIKQIIDTAKSRNIKIVFIQKQFNQEKAKTIAHEIGGSVIPIDPLDYNWHDQLLSISKALVLASNTQ
jgi:zinc transport system substrate-binding protein